MYGLYDWLPRRLVMAAAPAVIGALSGLVAAPSDWKPATFLALSGSMAGAALPNLGERVDEGAPYWTVLVAVGTGLIGAFGIYGFWLSFVLGPVVALALTIYLWVPVALARGSEASPTLEDAARWWRATGIWLAFAALPALGARGSEAVGIGVVTALGGLLVALDAQLRMMAHRRLWRDARDGKKGLVLIDRTDQNAPPLLRDRGLLDGVIARVPTDGPYRGNALPLALAPRDRLRPAPMNWHAYPTAARRLTATVGTFLTPFVAWVAGYLAASPGGYGHHFAHDGIAGMVASLAVAITGFELLSKLDPRGRAYVWKFGSVCWLLLCPLFMLFLVGAELHPT